MVKNMKSKKFLLTALSILILFVFIASASASDVNKTTDSLSVDESANMKNNLLSVDNDVKSNELTKESNDELLTSGNDWYVNSSKTSSGNGKSEEAAFKTLNEALINTELQDYDTIRIASGEYSGVNENIGLTIIKNLNFIKYGDGEAIFDAKGLSNIWTINSTSINITGLTFKNGNSTNGGAIYISHEVKSNINATFINNTAEEKGGAIYIVSGGISGNVNSIFINNTAPTWGGAIFIDSGGVSGNVNGTFINNKAGRGSAIFIAGGISGNVYGTFINNEAKSLGTIDIYNGDVSGNINGTFINNIANEGGAIAVEDDGSVSGNIYGIFINNTGTHCGGAIYIMNSNNNLNGKLDGIFINNKAEDGGAIYIEFIIDHDVSIHGIYINNTAGEDGGAIFVNEMGCDLNIRDSIFLNNNNSLSFRLSFNNIKTTNCWFGNNATNYNIKPDAGKGIVDDWLFLNATASSTEILWSQNSIIAFKLESYDISSGEVKLYDASKMNFILDLTQTLGELDKTAASIGENITYTAKQEGNASVTGKFKTASYTVQLTNVETRIRTEINVTNSTIGLKVKENVTAATLTPADAGALNYNSTNTNVARVENGVIIAVGAGKAIITVSFDGNDNYAPAISKTIEVTVTALDARVIVNQTEFILYVGDETNINAKTVPAGLNVTYVVDDSGVVNVSEDGIITALKNGIARIAVNVGDDVIYVKNSTIITVSVNKIPTEIVANAISTVYDVDKNLIITLKDVNGKALEGINVTIDLNGVKNYTTDTNGQVKVSTKGFAPKSYTAIVTFAGDAVYVGSLKNVKVTVKKATPKLTAKNKKFKKSKKVKKYSVRLKTNTNNVMKNVKVTLKIKGKKKITAKTNAKGIATFKIKKLTKMGSYKSKVTFKGNNYYKMVSKKVKIKIK